MNLKELESQIAELNLKKQELLKRLDEQKDLEIKQKLKEIKPVTNHYTLTFTVNVTERLLNVIDKAENVEYDISVKGSHEPGQSPITKKTINELSTGIKELVEDFVCPYYSFGRNKIDFFTKAAEKHNKKMESLV